MGARDVVGWSDQSDPTRRTLPNQQIAAIRSFRWSAFRKSDISPAGGSARAS